MVEQRRAPSSSSKCPVRLRVRSLLLLGFVSLGVWSVSRPVPSAGSTAHNNGHERYRDPPVDCVTAAIKSATTATAPIMDRGLLVQAFADDLPGTKAAKAILPELHPFTMHVHNTTDDAYISHDIATLGCFECELVAYAARALQQYSSSNNNKKKAVLLDIGGNIGMYSLTAASLNYQAYVVEPFAKNWQHTCASLLYYNQSSLVTLFNRAVLAERGVVTFKFDETTRNQGSVKTVLQKEPETSVKLNNNNLLVEGVDYAQGVPLGDLLRPHLQLDQAVVLKVDVEGHECHVLGGALEFLRTLNIVYVALEWSQKRLWACYQRADIFDLLHKRFRLMPYMYNPNHLRNGRPVWMPLDITSWDTTWVQRGKRKHSGLFDVVWSRTPL